MKNLLLIALSTIAVSANAWEPEVYAGAGITAYQYQHDTTPTNNKINMLEATAGLNLIEYLGIEARIGAGLNTSTDTLRDADGVAISTGEAEVNFSGSLYLKPQLTNERARLYGLLGYTTVDVTHTQNGVTVLDDSEGGLAYGIGASWMLWPKAELTAEWKKLVNSDDFDVRGGSVGFIYKF